MRAIFSVLLVLCAVGATAQEAILPPMEHHCGASRINTTKYIINDCAGLRLFIPQHMEKQPLLNINLPTCFKLDRAAIKTMPYTDIKDMLSVFPTVHQQQRGGNISISGGRYEATLYVLDGMVIML